jgi:hypothetical protein
MKNKLSFRSWPLVLAILVTAGTVCFNSCKKDNSTAKVDKTVLADSITAAKTLLAGATEGVAAGDYPTGSKATLQTVIDAVQAISNNTVSTQANIDAAVVNLHNAMVTFRGAVIVPVAQSNIIAQWKFDEGTGTTVADASTNHLTGTFVVGFSTITGNGPLPEWTTDRFGAANKALHFAHGGHIEVPYNSVLFPAQISISLWAKVDNVFADNYMLSQNWWTGWKLQYQSANKVFFTYQNAAAVFYDRDWSVTGQDTTAWHHVVVTLKEGEEDFYADGQLVKSWTDVTGGLNAVANPVAFCIGQEFPNTRPGIAPADDPAQYSAGYYKGSLDDVTLYNVALTASQVMAIYNMEKP